ncbi:hypothetical protein SOJ_18370 [Staphylococcus sp. OJ82]|nr:hypothetical protein SOJ_18370 [Staphylococcus sp. OJ82]CCI60599.1 putative uncharacterized protein [Staphylococcus equorum subsp. equorum Mu2]
MFEEYASKKLINKIDEMVNDFSQLILKLKNGIVSMKVLILA